MSLVVPRILLGKYANVRREAMAFMREFEKGARLDDLDEQLIEVSNTSALIVLRGPSPLLASEEHVHAFELPRLLPQDAGLDACVRFFDQALTRPWALLCLMDQDAFFLLRDDRRSASFLNAAARYWSELSSVGDRYSFGVAKGLPIWELAEGVHGALVRLGLPPPLTREPLPDNDLSALMHRHAELLGPRG
jgi:hypothetical protein